MFFHDSLFLSWVKKAADAANGLYPAVKEKPRPVGRGYKARTAKQSSNRQNINQAYVAARYIAG